jgi:hypothetical protein
VQQVFPFAKVALEANALSGLEAEDDAWLDLLARLDCSFAGFADTTFKIEVSVYLHYTRSSAQRLLPFFAYLPIRVASAIM